ncbi:nuclease [Mycobacterium sp. CBMA293]|uniref:ParB-like nuclease domain protein n=1 Tax=Mycolicibacterium sp. CBMA 213 TaxID=1968788 RepID=A0A1S6GKX0_9MYCO|nr:MULTISPECIES: ParB/RepB/Spo0J family partition protein [unclassified Mycolicibacterium]AQS22508.1 ParB-like nuclease domain protein [Mycolicibacterium sp. CBMA 213]MUL48408.1 nuclease [Mycolicibacterium sp. CBMA 360]MUL62420.1 nuclease [Mycolicibacterium sp. CBMA 335]MUM04557.1 nuclease [Mycolicibacterium sp. CBMA 213]MUM14820.1 nuclease [Mycolicibacterium sp. CBMA 293]
MTDNAHTDTTAPELAQQGTIEHLDPNLLEIGDNVRDVAELTKEFVSSIAENGVLVPITGVRSAENLEVVRIRNGQRRTLAAREVGLATVPVYVLPSAAADAAEDLIERVVHQIVTNDQARALTDAQRAKGIQQMIDAGMSVTKVSKKLSVHKDTVKAAQTAAGSQAALEYLDSTQISLTEAAALAEFENDPAAMERLVNVAGTGRFDYTIEQLRIEAASAEALAKEAQKWVERGYTVLDSRPSSWDPTMVPLNHLVRIDAEGTEADATEESVTDPAQWAVLLYEGTALVDKTTGELVNEDDVDWATEDEDDAVPEDGLRHANTVEDRDVFNAEYFCLDYAAAGLAIAQRRARQYFPELVTGEDDDTDAAQAEAQARAEADAQAEADKRERRKVLALNKLGSAAIIVRREFITKLLTRKTAPKGAVGFVADALARDAYMLTGLHADDTAAELLGLKENQPVRTHTKGLDASADARAQVILLGMVLGALEARTGKDAWRNPGIIGGTASWARNVTGGEYLKFLVSQGYTLSPVEEVITGERTSDQVYDEYLAEAQAA